jgi:hypothetical protein
MVVGSALVIVALGASSSWGVRRIVLERREEISGTLATVLETTHQAIRSWANEQRASVQAWAASPEIVELTRALLAVPRTPAMLLEAPAQAQIRSRLHPVNRTMRYRGFSIIAPDGSNLSSARDTNVGVPNLLLRAGGNDLERLWHGDTMVSSPQPSDVALRDIDGQLREAPPTMFVGAPIRDHDGSIIAALTFRIDPALDFTALLQRGRIGASGETYAFDRQGRLSSESRFDAQLRTIGLLAPHQNSILNIEIRDPGRDLTRAGAAPPPPGPLLLTRMARSAIMGSAGSDLDGYRDYRGVEVIGQWLWDPDLNLGITSEIDRSEAYATLNSTRSIVLALTLLAMSLTGGLTALFAVWLRLSARLEDALAKVLSGYLPICAACKKIRDEHEVWTQVESYVQSRTSAEFTHSICPECEQVLYPEIADDADDSLGDGNSSQTVSNNTKG